MYVFFAFGKNEGTEKEKFIAEATRKNIYITLSVLSAAGVLFLFLLRRAATADGEPVQNTQTGSGILSAIKLLGHGRILLLSITFWFTGNFFYTFLEICLNFVPTHVFLLFPNVNRPLFAWKSC